MRKLFGLAAVAAVVVGAVAQGQPRAAATAAQLAPGQNCTFVTEANAAASAGTPNVNHDGTPLPGVTPPDISRGFQGIPRSTQPPLTASQRRILECTYRLAEANADMPYTLFIPSSYDPSKPTPMILNLHGLNITPLQQILFDGVTDLAERYGYIVVAPMGYSLNGGYRGGSGQPVATAQLRPGGTTNYTTGDLSEIDSMTVLRMVREKYNIDPNRIYLMGHSMGGGGTYALGGKFNTIWAGIAPLAGAGAISSPEAAQAFRNIPVLLYHGDRDSIVSPTGSLRSAMNLQAVGGQHLLVMVPGADHEFWIRRNAKNMERVFSFFNTVSKDTNRGFITPEMIPPPAAGRGGAGRGAGAPGRGGATPPPAG